MLISGLDPSIPSWTIWASHPSELHTWNSGEEDNHCLLDNDLLRAYCVSYSFVIIRVIKKNKIWPYFSNCIAKRTCQQIAQIRVMNATVHVWAGLRRGIKKGGCKECPVDGHCHLHLCQSLSVKQSSKMGLSLVWRQGTCLFPRKLWNPNVETIRGLRYMPNCHKCICTVTWLWWTTVVFL